MSQAEGNVLGGRYRLQELLARGGMGEVWRAVDDRLGREVAVKVLHAAYAGDSDFHERFRAEARNTAAFSHANVAQVYDFGETDGTPYLIMELVPGEPLSLLIERQGAIGVPRTLDVLAQTARALEAAHAAGVVHRDIKPGNLLVTPDGRVKVTDFGIARAADSLPLTATGTVMGSAPYLSPEQAHGRTATAASDVYALGVVAYECLAGLRPFIGETAVDVAAAHAQDTPPPLPLSVPQPLKDLVFGMLAKDPEARPVDRAVAERSEALRGAGGAGAVGTLTSAHTAVVPRIEPSPTRTQSLPPVGAAGAGAAGASHGASGGLRPFTPEPRGGRGVRVALAALLALALVGGGAWGLSSIMTGGDGDDDSASPSVTSSAEVSTPVDPEPSQEPEPVESATAEAPEPVPTPEQTEETEPSEEPSGSPTPTDPPTPTETPTETPTATPTPSETDEGAEGGDEEFDPAAFVGRNETEAYAAIEAAGGGYTRERQDLTGDAVPCSVADIRGGGGDFVVFVWWPEDGDSACAPLDGSASRSGIAAGGENGPRMDGYDSDDTGSDSKGDA